MFFEASTTFQSDTRANVSEEPEGLLCFFAACMRFQTDTRANVSEEPEGLCFSRLCMTFQKIPERMSLKSQEAFNVLVPCSTY